MSSCVFFLVTCYSALKQHGNTEYMIKNCFHGYKVIKFNKDNMKGEWPGAQFEKEHEVDALVAFAKEGSDVAGKDEL